MISKKYLLVRLKNSSLRELIYRIKESFLLWRLKGLSKKQHRKSLIPSLHHFNSKNIVLPYYEGNILPREIDEILNGKIRTLSTDQNLIRVYERSNKKNFFTDVKFSPDCPDIRTIWEPARLQHITALLAYARTGQSFPTTAIIKRFVKASIMDWIDENPFLFGPHYMSAMECGLRIPVFCYCLSLLDDLSPLERDKIVDTVYRHAWFVSKRLSRYSSLGNHTVAECTGLVFAGTLFRQTKEGFKWLRTGYELLRQEARHQILDDGGPAEQSLNYHRFVLDLYWLSLDFLEKNTTVDCSGIKNRLVQGETFLNTFHEYHGILPSIGDSDDSWAIAPGLSPKKDTISSVDIATPEAGQLLELEAGDSRNQKFCPQPSSLPLEVPGPLQSNFSDFRYRIFPTTGYTLVKTMDGLALTFDHGPLGMPPLHCHGHADALSVIVTQSGTPVLVDPGTYRYNGEPEFRKYFRSTRAHNTVTIDGMDQAIQETGFIWSRPYTVNHSTCSQEGGRLICTAQHNGYARLKDPIWHKRTLCFFANNNFIITDSFQGTGVHTFELNYHFHPDAVLNNDGEWWRITIGESAVFMTLLKGDSLKLVKGNTKPVLGWY